MQDTTIYSSGRPLRCALAGSDLIREVGRTQNFHSQCSPKGNTFMYLRYGKVYFSLYCMNCARQQGVKY